MLNFISYHTSVRNEEKTTTQKFKDDIIKKEWEEVYFKSQALSEGAIEYVYKGIPKKIFGCSKRFIRIDEAIKTT